MNSYVFKFNYYFNYLYYTNTFKIEFKDNIYFVIYILFFYIYIIKMNPQERLGEHYQRYDNRNINESNQNNYIKNNFNTVFSDQNKNLSILQEPDIEYTRVDQYLIINSKERDVNSYPSASQFVLNLPQEYRNVSRIELIQCIIPDKNNVASEPYLLLNINELENTMESNNKAISDAFSILPLDQATVPGKFIKLVTQIHEKIILNYKTPKASLSKVTLSVTDSDGQIFDFGGAGSIEKEFQCLFVFKITTLDKSQKSLNQRNLY
jgi:hypothetical protein